MLKTADAGLTHRSDYVPFFIGHSSCLLSVVMRFLWSYRELASEVESDVTDMVLKPNTACIQRYSLMCASVGTNEN